MPERSYIGIDVGTSGCRAVVMDRHGNVVANARHPLPASTQPQPGWSEQQPTAWWDALLEVLGQVADGVRGTIPTLCLDATSSTLLLIDATGHPLTPGLMYDDRRAEQAAMQVAGHAPAESPARGAGSALSKLLYLLDTEAAGHAAFAAHQADWLSGRLTGHFGLSDENNALKLGYDPVNRQWPDWLAKWRPACDFLPTVLPVGTPIGQIDPAVATPLNLPPETIVAAGTTDSNAATLAASGCHIGDMRSSERPIAVTSLGSTLVIKLWSDQPIFSSRYGVYSHRIGDRWLVGGASNTGGRVLRKFFSDDALAALSNRIDPAIETQFDYYPLPASGERFPIYDPELRARLTPRPRDDAEFLHGLLEGIARIEAAGYRRLVELGAPYPAQVMTSGRGAANPTWSKIRERVLGIPVVEASQQEAAYGAACLARLSATPEQRTH